MRSSALTWRVCLVLAGILGSAQAREFEVATVKPSAATGIGAGRVMAMLSALRPPGSIQMIDPGRVRMKNESLIDLIAAAWRVRATQVSGPGWMADQRFDVEAKVPDGTPREEVNEMLQSLLAERFGLKLHQETRTLAGYALVVAKGGPKLKISEPRPLIPTGQLPFPVPKPPSDVRRGGSHFHFGRMTMESLCNFLSTKTDGPVIDMTGLTEKYDIDLETAPDTPDEPGVTIFEAIEQLGLKLESRKVPIETVVVDQVAKRPAAN